MILLFKNKHTLIIHRLYVINAINNRNKVRI